MMDSTQVGDMIETLVEARVRGEDATLIGLIDGLMKGVVADVMNVVLVMAGILAEEFDDPGPQFHAVTVSRVGVDGVVREASVDDIPPHVATFARMVAALANRDRSMAIDLFIGFVGVDGLRALPLLVFALNEVVHLDADCPVCRPQPESA